MAVKQRAALGKAMVESTEEATTMTWALLHYLLGLALNNKELTDDEKAHLSGSQILCILTVLNDHLGRIGSGNFNVTMRQVQDLIERERTGVASQAGLARLSALLLPLSPLIPQVKN